MPTIARIACVVAFITAGGALILVLSGQVILLPYALIPLFAGIGMVRKRAWGPYGYALLAFAQVVLLPVVLFRSDVLTPRIIAAALFQSGLGVLFLFAGRSLAATGAERGTAWPWIVVAALTTVPLFFYQALVVTTPAMANTILAGDRILVQRFPEPSPERGDIIVFRYPVDISENYVKRVIGIAGDHIHLEEKFVILNGKKLVEPYARHDRTFVVPYADDFPSIPPGPDISYRERERAQAMFSEHVVNGEVVVPQGYYFVLGDNRDDSSDSRYWGLLPRENINGKPVLVLDSEELRADGKPTGLFGKRWGRFFRLL